MLTLNRFLGSVTTARPDLLTRAARIEERPFVLQDIQAYFSFGITTESGQILAVQLGFKILFLLQAFRNHSILLHSFSLIELDVFLEPTNVEYICELAAQCLLLSMGFKFKSFPVISRLCLSPICARTR